MPKPPPTARKPKAVKQYRAMYDYEADNSGDASGYTILSFEEGDIITLVEEIDDHWIKARVNNQEGIVPKSFVDERASQVFPLHEACRRGNLEQINQYLQEKVPVNQRDNTNGTPLYYASGAGYLDCVQALLNTNFVDFKIKNNFKETPLHAAAAKGFSDVVKSLVAHNTALVSSNNPNGMKDLLTAANKLGKTALDLSHDAGTIGYLKSEMGLAGGALTGDINRAAMGSDEEDSEWWSVFIPKPWEEEDNHFY